MMWNGAVPGLTPQPFLTFYSHATPLPRPLKEKNQSPQPHPKTPAPASSSETP